MGALPKNTYKTLLHIETQKPERGALLEYLRAVLRLLRPSEPLVPISLENLPHSGGLELRVVLPSDLSDQGFRRANHLLSQSEETTEDERLDLTCHLPRLSPTFVVMVLANLGFLRG